MRINELKKSYEKFGPLLPIVRDKHGNVVDGFHREKIDKDWPSSKRKEIDNEEKRILVAMQLNWLRRDVDDEEKTEYLVKLCKMHPEWGKYGSYVTPLAELTGFSDRWIQKLLPPEYKQEQRKVELSSAFLKCYTIWNFQEADPAYVDPNFPTQLPAQIIQNLLYYFTEPDDLIIDPMAGSGLVERVAKDMGRKCESYDINPHAGFIKKHDILDGIPSAEKADLIFLDPPYFKMKDYGTDVERGSIKEFYDFIKAIAHDAFAKMKKGAKIAYIVCDLPIEPHILTLELFPIFKDQGFFLVANIVCPLTAALYRGDEINRAKEEKRMLPLVRNLVVFEK